jgi:hypothetical protein
MDDLRSFRRALALAAVFLGGQWAVAGDEEPKTKPEPKYRGLLGPESWKIRKEGDKTFLWAGGERSGEGARWYDFTGAKIPPEGLQFGIGKDRIRSIDDPLFVSPDDPRLLKLPASPYRTGERPKTAEEIMVIGYVHKRSDSEAAGEARAYPTALLDYHELVTDRVAGKPITVGW